MPALAPALVRRSLGAALPAAVLAPALALGGPATAVAAPAAAGGAFAGIGIKTAPVVRAATHPLVRAHAAARAAAAAPSLPGRRVAARGATRLRVVRVAAALRGRPYHYGATGPRSFDCSGYTRYVFARAAHRSLPHSSAAQYALARHIPRSAIRPGDLVFFVQHGHVYHVGIYAGHGLIWHAPHTGDRVRLAHISTSSWVAGRVL